MNYLFINACGVVKEGVIKSLEIMGYGVLAIFIVIAILILLVKLMGIVEKRSEARKAAEGYAPSSEKLKKKLDALKANFSKKEDAQHEDTPPDKSE